MGRFGKYNNPSRKKVYRKPDYTEKCIAAGKRMIESEAGYNSSICPICKREYIDPPAISRRDNKTPICPSCGIQEALQDYARRLERR